MRFAQKLALECIIHFIYENYTAKNTQPNASIASIPWIGSSLAAYYKAAFDILMAKMGDPDLKTKKIRSALNFCSNLLDFGNLSLDGEQSQAEQIKKNLLEFINAQLKREKEGEQEKDKDKEKGEEPKEKTAVLPSAEPSNSIDRKTQMENASDPLQIFYQALDAMDKVPISETHFMRLLYLLIEREQKKIKKIELEHGKPEKNYDLSLVFCQNLVIDVSEMLFGANHAQYVLDGKLVNISPRTVIQTTNTLSFKKDKSLSMIEQYFRSKLDSKKSDSLAHLTEVFIDQFLATKMAFAGYHYNLETLMSSLVLPMPTVAKSGCMLVDSKLRGNKEQALSLLSILMQNAVNQVLHYAEGRNEKRCQIFLQNILYAVSEIEVETGYSLKEILAPLKEALSSIKDNLSSTSNSRNATTTIVSTATQISPTVAMGSATTATACAPIKPPVSVLGIEGRKEVTEAASTPSLYAKPIRYNAEVNSFWEVSRGRKKALDLTERKTIVGVNLKQHMSFPQLQAQISSRMLHATCIHGEGISEIYGGPELAKYFGIDPSTSTIIPSSTANGTGITAADLLHEALGNLLYDPKAHDDVKPHVNLFELGQDPKTTGASLKKILSDEVERVTGVLNAHTHLSKKRGVEFELEKEFYPSVLQACKQFIIDAQLLNPYSDWYLQAKMSENQNPADFLMVSLMEEYLNFIKNYHVLDLLSKNIKFSDDFELPKKGMTKDIISQILVFVQECLADFTGPLGETFETVLISFRSLLYSLKEIASKNAVDLNEFIAKLENYLRANMNQLKSMNFSNASLNTNPTTNPTAGYFPSGGTEALYSAPANPATTAATPAITAAPATTAVAATAVPATTVVSATAVFATSVAFEAKPIIRAEALTVTAAATAAIETKTVATLNTLLASRASLNSSIASLRGSPNLRGSDCSLPGSVVSDVESSGLKPNVQNGFSAQ